MSAPTCDVLVLVGTDHHPFDRMVAWVDAWAARSGARVLVQHGTSTPPSHAQARPLLTRGELDDVLATRPVVVAHGGPGTIADARDAGVRPIVLPRRTALGEHVDDHQVRFTARMHDVGAIVVPTTEDELHALLDAALADPTSVHVDPSGDQHEVAAATDRFAAYVTALEGRRRRRRLPAPPLRPHSLLRNRGRADAVT